MPPFGYAVQDRSFEVELHHYADGLCEACIHATGKLSAHTLPFSISQEKDGKWLAVFEVRVGLGIIALRRWAERPFDGQGCRRRAKEILKSLRRLMCAALAQFVANRG